jgi:hypothetical protein
MRIALNMFAGAGILLTTGIYGVAFAQSASQPDKSQYTLFNPVPDDEMRDFNTDRPPKANVPYTVDAGHFQYETDLINFAGNQMVGAVRTDTWLVPNPTFKLGLTNNIDFEINATSAYTASIPQLANRVRSGASGMSFYAPRSISGAMMAGPALSR